MHVGETPTARSSATESSPVAAALAALWLAAQALTTALTADWVGVEEFVVLAPDADVAELAERCRDAIAAQPMLAGAGLVDVTVSVGAAMFPDHASDAAELLREADRALYAAKASGRNAVVQAA